MLFFFTALTDFMGMSISLWLATYLLARGFHSHITLRAVITLTAIAAFFLSAYLNLYHPISGTEAWRAALLILGFLAWYDFTYQLLPTTLYPKARWVAPGVYALGLAALIFLFGIGHIFVESDNPLFVTQVRSGPGYVGYGLCATAITVATLYNLRLGAAAGAGPYQRYFIIATLMAAGIMVVGYGLVVLASMPRVPRLVQDGLLLSAVIVIGYSVARYQTLVRRTTLQDLPIAGLALLGIIGLYAFLAQRAGLATIALAPLTVLLICTHSAYDALREFLDRLLHRQQSALRRQLRQLAREVGNEGSQVAQLQQGLTSLCQTLNASGGFIALRQDEQWVVRLTTHSLSKNSLVEVTGAVQDDIALPPPALAEQVAWLAPAIVENEMVAVIGLGPQTNQSEYAEADLDLLAEVADWVGRVVWAQIEQQKRREQVMHLMSEVSLSAALPPSHPQDLFGVFENEADPQFSRLVENGLRHLADYTILGQSALVTHLHIKGLTPVERGKAVREQIIRAIETLRPAGPRPAEPLPREWYGYAILHDAYIEDAPNREIMARLYISEGTFNRQRRKALRAVVHACLETKSSAPD